MREPNRGAHDPFCPVLPRWLESRTSWCFRGALMVLGVVVFMGGLLLSIALHELGHFLSARRAGMVASAFFVGFGPKVLSWTRGETTYGLRLIPVGGYVKIEGMRPGDPVPGGDEGRAFWRQSTPTQLVTLVSGGLVHFFIGFLLLVVLIGGIGVPRATLTIASTETCATCEEEVSPAQAAGVLPGDELVTVDGSPVQDWNQVLERVRLADGPVALTVDRNGSTVTRTVTPIDVEGSNFLGIRPQIVQERSGVEGLGEALTQTGLLVQASYQGLVRLPAGFYNTARDLVTGGERDADGPVGVVGAARISGELSESGTSSAATWSALLALLATVNIFLGVFNLLPIPPLDGGQAALVLFERIRHRVRQVRGYKGPLVMVDPGKVTAVVALGAVLFVGLSLVVLVADVINPLRIL